MNKFLVILIFGIIFMFYKIINSKKTKNLKLDKFKNKRKAPKQILKEFF